MLVACWVSAGIAQDARTYVARLSPVPITVAMQDTVSGVGSVTATLTGNRLVVDGKFEGLRTPATVARIHMAPRAMRGPAIADLKVATGTRGTVTGSVELNGEQRQALEKSSLYIQLHSEKAPEGNLWGWLVLASPKPGEGGEIKR
ncbi:MAG: CHRD domain-containing protein [Panacagrimonas sp.]